MKRLILVLIGLAMLGMAPAMASVIFVHGDVSGTWSADTVIVDSTIRVPRGQSLTIMPGVEVLFWVACQFKVESGATLSAIGTPTDSIRFDEYWPGNHWKGIRFLNASSSSQLSYCHLKNGLTSGLGVDAKGGAIYCNYSSPTIQHCLIDNCSAPGNGGGICCTDSSNAIISDNTIVGNSTQTNGGGIAYSGSNPQIINNFISGNVAGSGGGIFCEAGTAIISNNTITNNSGNSGGGICCNHDDALPTISNNTIDGNNAGGGGGIWCYSNNLSTNLTIVANIITNNTANSGGGGIAIHGNADVTENLISRNHGGLSGGGIHCYALAPIFRATIFRNVINENTATNGGGAFIAAIPDTFELNEITGNTASSNGGGIYSQDVSFTMNKNTIAANTAETGGGLYCTNSSPTLRNCILWGNSPVQQIYQTMGSNAQLTYTDLQGIWPGIGNINQDPQFVNSSQGDYHLQASSPCINTGNPNVIYNDPDFSRADMGCYYYHHTTSPIQVTLTPVNPPIVVPANGGSFQFTVAVIDTGSVQQPFTVWARIKYPDGTWTNPTLGPVTINPPLGVTITRQRTQNVPGSWPAGSYLSVGYVAQVYPGPVMDSSFFSWTKSVISDGGPIVTSAFCGGELFPGEVVSSERIQPAEPMQPGAFILRGASPNPFNSTTSIRYELPMSSYTHLQVYDTAGRVVSTLVNGWREAGEHEATFDGSRLASGVYLVRLEAGSFTAVQKIVLLK